MDRPPPGTIKQGYLKKSPPLEKRGIKAWKKRWCIFSILGNTEEPSLKYFKNEEDSFYAPTPIKRVSLRHCFKIEVDLHHTNHRNIFALHLPERVYYFSAPSRMEMNEWAESLCTNLRLHNPNFLMSGERSTLPVTPPANRAAKSGTFPRNNLYGNSVPTPSETPVVALVSDNMYTTRPLPPEIPLPPIPNDPISSSVTLPPPPEMPLPPVPLGDLYSTTSRSVPRSTSPNLRHQKAPSPFSSDEVPDLPPRLSLSPPYLDDIANRPPAPLPHASRASRPPGPAVPLPPLPPARNQSNGGSSTSPPLSLSEPEDDVPPTPPPRQEVTPLSRISSRAEHNIYVTS